MKDAYKPKDQLITELEELRQRLARLQASEARDAWARAEGALRHSEERFRELFENAPDAICTCDSAGRFTAANHAFESLIGRARHELLSMMMDEIIVPGSHEVWRALVTEACASLRAAGEVDVLTGDGRTVRLDMAIRATPCPDRGVDNGAELQVIARDASARASAKRTIETDLQRSEMVFRAAAVGVARLDSRGRFIDANPSLLELTGYSSEELVGHRFTDYIPREQAVALMADFKALVERRRDRCRTETRCVRKDGSIARIDLAVAVVRPDNTGPYFIVTVDDASGRSVSERRLREENDKLTRRVGELEQRTREVSLLNETGDLLQACRTTDEAYGVITRMAAQLFPGDSGSISVTGATPDLVEAVAAWGLRSGDRLFGSADCWGLRRGRVHVVQDVTTEPMCRHMDSAVVAAFMCVPMMAHGEAVGLLNLSVGKAGQLTEAKQRLATTMAEHIALSLANLRLRDSLRRQSIRDPLTGLFNRRYMEESLEREMRRAGRGRHPVGIIMLDLDHFKQFNDSYGHEAGDNLMREVGGILQRSIRGEDIACRYGGEEFILILPEASLADAAQRGEHIREAIRSLRIIHRRQPLPSVTVSLGVAIYPDHGPTGEAVLRAADAALYQAKARGRDRVAVAEAGTESGSVDNMADAAGR